MKKYNCLNQRIYKILKYFSKEPLRNLSQSQSLAIYQGKVTKFYYTAKYIQHTTWDNKKYVFRSSYELHYAKQLDKQKTEYLFEPFRINYFDTELQKVRISVPDFFLPNQNKLVEVKSIYFLNKQNTKDRVLAYNEAGYEFELILDKKSTNISSF